MKDSDRLSISFPSETDWHHFELINRSGDSHVTIASFNEAQSSYAIEKAIPRQPELEVFENQIEQITKNGYLELIRKAIEFCETDDHKVVCSRWQFFEIDIDTSRWLHALREEFPLAFIYLLESAEYGVWIGASPELLVSKRGNRFRTQSLAGTKWNGQSFTFKEKREQEVVTKSILGALNLQPECASEVREVAYGKVKHLESIIEWKANDSLSEIVSKLHPTPAVGGFPNKEAIEFIEHKEKYNRELYTGYIALELGPDVSIAFVNLRCAKVFNNGIQIFAGGGVNRWSDPTSEWEETQQKMNTIRKVLEASGEG